jgi:hypothetical protein
MTDFLRVDARMALARYESSVAAFGMEAGFPMKDVYAVKEYIERLETMLLKSADRIEKLEAEVKRLEQQIKMARHLAYRPQPEYPPEIGVPHLKED